MAFTPEEIQSIHILVQNELPVDFNVGAPLGVSHYLVQQMSIWSNEGRELWGEEELTGWLFNQDISKEQMNNLFHLLSLYTNVEAGCPQEHKLTVPIPESCVEFSGKTLLPKYEPHLYYLYDGYLPDLRSEAPTGYTYITRSC